MRRLRVMMMSFLLLWCKLHLKSAAGLRDTNLGLILKSATVHDYWKCWNVPSMSVHKLCLA